jgi:hypothetical protein
MFTEPASKVSVPLTVVKLILLAVPPASTLPAPVAVYVASANAPVNEYTQIVPEILTIVIIPLKTLLAITPPAVPKPVVKAVAVPPKVPPYELAEPE